jgi:hypothetical protein
MIRDSDLLVKTGGDAAENDDTESRAAARFYLLSPLYYFIFLLLGQKNRADRTAIELFWQGLDNWDSTLRRQMDDGITGMH